MLFKIVIALGLLAFSHQSIINLPPNPSLRTAPTNKKPSSNSVPRTSQCKMRRINQIMKIHKQVNVLQANFETKISEIKNSNNNGNEQYNEMTKKVLIAYEFENYLQLLLQKYNGQDCNLAQPGLSEIQVSIVNNFANMLNAKMQKEEQNSLKRERKTKQIEVDTSVEDQSEVTNSEIPIETTSANEASSPTIVTENSSTQVITTPNTMGQNIVSETSQSNELSALTTSTIDTTNLTPESITQISQAVDPSSPTTASN